jgi:DNA-binding NarL/FixJ family response regulator
MKAKIDGIELDGSVTEIAELIRGVRGGIVVKNIITQRKKRATPKRRRGGRRNKRWTPREMREVWLRKTKGESLKKIAREMKRDYGAIYQRARQIEQGKYNLKGLPAK